MTAGLPTMLRIQWRVQRLGIVVWVAALAAGMVATVMAVAELYDTPEKIQSYASAVSGDALLAINGRVEGIDTLGGVIQDEFGFLASFVMPLLGISLVARSTRREEEAGRLEAILGGRIGRGAPVFAALALATLAIGLTGIAFTTGLVVAAVPPTRAVLYAASLCALAFVFAALAGLLAQLVLHARSVYAWSLVVLAAGYVLRGVGDVTGTWLTWLSPLGWAEKAAPFGPARWWTLAMPLILGALMTLAAVLLAARRDLGSAVVRTGAGPARASAPLRTAVGLAGLIHRPATLGWLAGALLLAAMMGSLARQLLDAMAANPALAQALGAAGERPEDGFLAMTQLYLAIIGTGYVVQAISSLRAEESAGRLEPRLAGTLSRSGWLAAHALVVLGGLVGIALASSGTLAATTAWSLGRGSAIGPVLVAGIAYLPAELLLGGAALAAFGLWPRALAAVWAGYAAATFIAFLGPGLSMPGWALDLAPTSHVGNPPLGEIHPGALAILSVIAVVLAVSGSVGFARRAVPHG